MTSLFDERVGNWLTRLTRFAFSLVVCSATPSCASPTLTLPETLTTDGGAATNAAGVGEAGAEANLGAGGAPAHEPATSKPNWCSAREVLSARCQRCHGDPPEHGAPFALSSYADIVSEDKRGTPRFVKMRSAIESDYMPATFLALEPPVDALDADEKSLLLDWLADSPPLEGACD